VLIAGEKGEAYNISNRNSIISIKEMAELVAQFAGVKLLFDIPDVEERKKFNPMINSSLDSKKIESLGWHGLFDASEGIKHTIQILEDEGDK
jgi:nucleoside-diphosphate-sugar epimerase